MVIYRNAVQPLAWAEDAAEAAKELGPRISILEESKIRLHLLSMGELGKAAVTNYEEAQNVAERIAERINPSFHEELNVAFNGLSIFRIGSSERRALVMPVMQNEIIDEERKSAIHEIPWIIGTQAPQPEDFQYRLRIGTVFSLEIDAQTICDTLIPTLPRIAMLQKGKIKTIE